MAVRGFEQDIVSNFSLGVITSILKDRLPDGAIPSAKNAQFYNIGPERAIFGTRQGCEVENETSVGSAIVSQYFLNAGTNYHLLVDHSGNLKKNVSGTITTVTATMFTDVDNQFSWQTVGSYAYVANGGTTDEPMKTNGVTSSVMGLQTALSGDWSISSVAGGGNLPTDTYDVAIAYYNSNTDTTGPVLAYKTISITNPNRIQVVLPSITTIDDPQVTHTKIFLRRQSTTTNFWYVAAGTDVAPTGTSGWAVAVGTTTVKIDSSAAQIAAFIIVMAPLTANYSPSGSTKFLANHRSRMFAATDTFIQWSEVGKPESFDSRNSLPVGEDDGEVITGMVEFKDLLIIFKQNAVYALVGSDPQTWAIELLDKTVGCLSYSSIAQVDNRLFWMSISGPQMWAGAGSNIVDITTELIGPNFDSDHIAPASLATSVAVPHPNQNYIGWAVKPVPETTRNTMIIPFNFKTNRWMSSEWNMIDVRSVTTILDSDGRQWPMVGDYDGTIYKIGVGDEDGLPSGTVSSGTLTDSTSNTLTDSTQSWGTNNLIGRYVYVWNETSGFRFAQRRRITANTSTALTLDSAWTSQPADGDNYSLGGIFFDWRSAFRDGGGPFFRKRIEFLFIELATPTGGIPVDVEMYTDIDEDTPKMARRITIGSGSLWDVANWDEMNWAGFSSYHKRIPIREMGYSWQTRLMHIGNGGSRIQVYTIGTQWLTKTKKTGTRI